MNHFFDIGANIGQTFDWYLLKTHDFDGWDVWCFEPSPRNTIQLLDRVRRLDKRFHVHVCPFGVAGKYEVARMYENQNPIGDSFFEHYTAGGDVSKVLDTAYLIHPVCVPLSQVIVTATEPGDSVVLKLDCEGGEYAALRDLLAHPEALTRCPRIMVEWHGTGLPGDDSELLTKQFAEKGITLDPWIF